jgi:hypothetical protein
MSAPHLTGVDLSERSSDNADAVAAAVVRQALARIQACGDQNGHPVLAKLPRLVSALAQSVEVGFSAAHTPDEALRRLQTHARETRAGTWVDNALRQVPVEFVQEGAAAVLHHMLYQALIELRSAAYEAGIMDAWRWADLVHNVPLQMRLVDAGRTAPDAVLHSIAERAGRLGLEHELTTVLPHGFVGRPSD